MRIKFVFDEEKIIENLFYEIDSRDSVRAYGLDTILPPEELCDLYLNNQLIYRNDIIDWAKNDIKIRNVTDVLNIVKNKWNNIENEFFEIIAKIINRKPLEKYLVFFTFYGPGGSYQLPDKLFLRLALKDDFDYVDVNMAHEIIHLMVENVVLQYNLDHIEKELFVNSIMFQPEIAQIFGLKNEAIKNSKFYDNYKKYF